MLTNLPQTNSKAVASLALGALSMVLLPALATTPFVVRGLGFRSPFEVLRAISIMLLPVLAAAPAIILGHQFRSQTENSEPPIRGDGMALGGLGIGYVSAALSATFIVFMVVSIPRVISDRITLHNFAARYTVAEIVNGETVYARFHPDRGYAGNLASLGSDCASAPELPCSKDATLYGPQCTAGTWCTRNDFRFIITAPENAPIGDFVIAAKPADLHVGTESFCATSDGVVRTKPGLISGSPTIPECLTWTPVTLLQDRLRR